MFRECETLDFKKFTEQSQHQYKLFGYDLDKDSGCSESCEMYEIE